MVLKVKTNLKLNLSAHDNPLAKMIGPTKIRDEEIHFIRMEGRYPKIEISLAELIWKKNTQRKFTDFEDWTITDFDDFLKGNPHV